MRAVLDFGPIARSNLARVTGRSAASITGLSAALLDVGLVRELPRAAGPPGVGRPHIPLDLDTGHVAVLGVHVAVPGATVALLDLRGRVLARRWLPHDRPTPQDVVDCASKQIASLAAEYAERRILGVGVATGGWVDAETGVVVDHALLGWRDVRLGELLSRATGLPTYLDSHGRALLRSEQLFGAHAARARESIVHLFVGNVVDASFSIRGRMHQGPRSAAGNLAHLPVDANPATTEPCACGRIGCLQAAVSEGALMRRAAELGASTRYVSDLAEVARAGDERVRELFVERAQVLGHAVACLMDLFHPQVLTLVEPGFLWVPQARDVLLAEVAARSETVEDPADAITPSSFPEPLSVAGGAVLLDRIYRTPLISVSPLSSAS
jgi:predicted NBD/HSP70 family sugar kinase